MTTSRPTRRAAAPAPAPAASRATRAQRPQAAASAPAADSLALARTRRQIEYVDISDIVPYEYNPRDNEKAIPAVAESIKAFGFLVPCVIDENNILVAGHTRTEGAKLLGLTEVPCIRANDLTPEQIAAFRLIDNKVAEQARWDHDLLAGEMAKLGLDDVAWTNFGWSQEEVDCLREVVADDCLDHTTLAPVAEAGAASHQARRAPQQARFVLGELVFFVSIETYRTWLDGIRQLHDFDEARITDELKRRLSILE